MHILPNFPFWASFRNHKQINKAKQKKLKKNSIGAFKSKTDSGLFAFTLVGKNYVSKKYWKNSAILIHFISALVQNINVWLTNLSTCWGCTC